MKAHCALALLVGAVALVPAAEVNAGFSPAEMLFNPSTSYRSMDDSPFLSQMVSGNGTFWLENFESGGIAVPGVTASTGSVRGPGTFTDSVDADGDGLLDGQGSSGHSFWTLPGEGGPTITFDFDALALGGLPTMAGIVWTDGAPDSLVTFEAFDEFGASLGAISSYVGDAVHTGSTAADRFFGAEFAGGISSFTISSEFGGLEVDHLQFGTVVVPTPGAAAAGLVAMLLGGTRRRRRG